MPKIGKFHPATLKELANWSTLSRNEIGPFLKRFGIEPLGRKYPMLRIYEGVLGLSPLAEAEETMLGAGLIRTTEVAGMIGLGPDALLEQLRAKNNDYPPLYVFGPRRHLMLRAQVEQMLSSPRNEWQSIVPIEDHAVSASRLARALKVRQSRIDTLLEDKTTPPAHIIAQGRTRYIIADVAQRLTPASSGDEKELAEEALDTNLPDGTPDAGPTSTYAIGGMFTEASKLAARQANAPHSCTGSGANARRGDGAHRVPAEAKLSGA